MGRQEPSLVAGAVVGGRYEILEPVAEGGMALVYRARHTGTQRECALKVIRPEVARQPKFVEKFTLEAQLAGRVGAHPHIADVFDSGVDADRGVPFIAMELLRGSTLEEVIARDGALRHELVATLVDQLADALGQAHDAGVVHRDLKLSNLFLTEDRKGRAHLKILDFGIAKVLSDAGASYVTQVGTPLYAAPEQLGRGIDGLAARHGVRIATRISAATDVFALGLVVYALLTGLDPAQYWDASTVTELVLRVALEPRTPASVRAGERSALLPDGFDAWFDRCLAHDASLRWQSVREAAAELLRVLSPRAALPATPDAEPWNKATLKRDQPAVGGSADAGAARAPGRVTPTEPFREDPQIQRDTGEKDRVRADPEISIRLDGHAVSPYASAFPLNTGEVASPVLAADSAILRHVEQVSDEPTVDSLDEQQGAQPAGQVDCELKTMPIPQMPPARGAVVGPVPAAPLIGDAAGRSDRGRSTRADVEPPAMVPIDTLRGWWDRVRTPEVRVPAATGIFLACGALIVAASVVLTSSSHRAPAEKLPVVGADDGRPAVTDATALTPSAQPTQVATEASADEANPAKRGPSDTPAVQAPPSASASTATAPSAAPIGRRRGRIAPLPRKVD